MDADTCSSFYSHPPQRVCCQKQVLLGVGAQDITASSSVPQSCIDKKKKSTVFSHVDFKLLDPKRSLEDIRSHTPHSLSQSLPGTQVGSVWGRFPHLHILWGFFLLLKHLSWALRGGDVCLSHLGDVCKQQGKPTVQEGVGLISKIGGVSLQSSLIITGSQTNKNGSRE